MVESNESVGADDLRRRDQISPISVVTLVLLVALQILSQTTLFQKLLHNKPKAHLHAEVAYADAEAFISIDTSAKFAYCSNLMPQAYHTRKDDVAIHDAVTEAEDQFRKTPQDASIARRVILLRAENGDVAPLAAIPAYKKHRAMPSPLGAYTDSEMAGERKLWVELFTQPKLPPHTDVARIKHEISVAPNLRWYRYLALHQLYLRVGDTKDAKAQMHAGAKEAARSLLPVAVVYIGMFVAGIVGLGLLVHQVTRNRSSQPDRFGPLPTPMMLPAAPPDELWPDILEPLGPRRLGAGDLFNVFVLYMLFFTLFDFAVVYGAHPYLKAHPAFERAHTMEIEIWESLAQQVLTGVAVFGVLFAYAKKYGASLAKEIWFRVGSIGANAGYGLAGWSMALPMVFVASLIAEKLLRNLPNPSNPGILMLTISHGFVTRLLLFLMICVFAPLIEETMFRGAFYQAARTRLGIWPAIIVTGVLFGSIHPVGLAGTVPLMILGSVFAWMAEKRKSLFPGMVAHFLQNTVSYIALISLYS